MIKAWYYSGGIFTKFASFYVTLLLPLWFPADVSASTSALWSLALLWSGILMSGQLEVQNKSLHKPGYFVFQSVYILLPLFLLIGLLLVLFLEINAFAVLVGLGIGIGMSRAKIELFLENYRRSFFQVFGSYLLIVLLPLQLLWFGVDELIIFQIAAFLGVVDIIRSLITLYSEYGLSWRKLVDFYPKIIPYNIQAVFSWLSGLGIGFILSLFLLDEIVVKFYVLFSLSSLIYFIPNLIVTVWGSTILRGQRDISWKWFGLSLYFLLGFVLCKYQGYWLVTKMYKEYAWSYVDIKILENIMLGYFITVPMWRAKFNLAFRDKHLQLNRNATLGIIVGVVFLYIGLLKFQWEGLGLSLLFMYSLQSLSISILSKTERYYFLISAALVMMFVL